MRFKNILYLLLMLGAVGCQAPRASCTDLRVLSAREDYQKLLAKFPEDAQGRGIDNMQPGVTEQSMTYGLVLSAEALHYRAVPNDESRRRIRKAAQWLVKNSDLDGDGVPGWGLPLPWDAFADGTTNGPNQPYTITTAVVLNGLLDGLSVSGIWSGDERAEMQELMRKVILHWCKDLWSEGYGGGYFWYSPCPCDNIFSINAPAMFLGSMTRFLDQEGVMLSEEERRLVQGRADDLARAMVTTVKLRDGAPYWDYTPVPNKFNNRQTPNDLVHQVYILWGAELYRDGGGRVQLPWNRAQAVESIGRFWRDGCVASYPLGVKIGTKSILWGIGAMLAFEAKYGGENEASRVLEALNQAYGPIPELRLTASSKDNHFYSRHAAHALWGLSVFCFGNDQLRIVR